MESVFFFGPITSLSSSLHKFPMKCEASSGIFFFFCPFWDFWIVKKKMEPGTLLINSQLGFSGLSLSPFWFLTIYISHF